MSLRCEEMKAVIETNRRVIRNIDRQVEALREMILKLLDQRGLERPS